LFSRHPDHTYFVNGQKFTTTPTMYPREWDSYFYKQCLYKISSNHIYIRVIYFNSANPEQSRDAKL
jgi:hypothetical protein